MKNNNSKLPIGWSIVQTTNDKMPREMKKTEAIKPTKSLQWVLEGKTFTAGTIKLYLILHVRPPAVD
jgi:hypothetical protein